MNSFLSWIARGCLAFLLVGSVAGMQPAFASEQPRQGGTLKISLLGLDTSDPHRHTGSIAVQQVYVESLVSIAPDGSIKPFLAESVTISPDGKEYTFKLRQGVRFHNGREMKSDDVVANFKRVQTKINNGWLCTAMKLMNEVTAPDDYTVIVRMNEPYAPFLSLLSELYILAPESPGWDDTVTTPIGTGPFMFGEWIPQVKLHAPRFSGYWMKGKPYLDAVEFNLGDKQDTSLMLRNGDLDIGYISARKAASMPKNSGVEITSLKDSGWYFWAFNNRNPKAPFDNLEVRRAIALCMDKKALMHLVAGDRAVVTNQMVKEGNAYFNKELHEKDAFAHPNLEEAKKILDREGVDPSKTTLRIVSWQTDFAQASAQMVKKLGFKVEHEALDDIGAQKRLGEYQWDLAPFDSGPRADIFLRYVRLMSDGPNPTLWGGIQDPELDTMIKAAVAESDQNKRIALYAKAWDRIMDKMYFVVAGHAPDLIGVGKRVHGYDTGFTWSQHRVDGGLAFTWLDE